MPESVCAFHSAVTTGLISGRTIDLVNLGGIYVAIVHHLNETDDFLMLTHAEYGEHVDAMCAGRGYSDHTMEWGR